MQWSGPRNGVIRGDGKNSMTELTLSGEQDYVSSQNQGFVHIGGDSSAGCPLISNCHK